MLTHRQSSDKSSHRHLIKEALEGVCKVKKFAVFFCKVKKFAYTAARSQNPARSQGQRKNVCKVRKELAENSKVILFWFENCKVSRLWICWEVSRSRKKTLKVRKICKVKLFRKILCKVKKFPIKFCKVIFSLILSIFSAPWKMCKVTLCGKKCARSKNFL